MIDVKKIREDFPMYKENLKMQGHPLVFLDNAATTFKPEPVLKAVESYYYHTSNSHRGDYDLAYGVDMQVLETRKAVKRFINAKSENEIVFTAGASMSLNLVAYGYGAKYLKEGDEILLTEAEHASNILPWFKVAEITGAVIKYIPLTKEGRLTAENVKKTIGSRTKLVCVAHITNVLGYVNDIKEIAKVVHEAGALISVDGAQSVPHIKVDVQDLNIDFLSFSGHKMCGPTGIGILYGKYQLLDMMDPFLSGGGMNAKFEMCGNVSYLKPPAKFEAGTQNLEGIYGLRTAIEYLEKIGMDNIEKYEKELKIYAVNELKKLDNVIVYNPESESGIITFNVKGVFAQDEATFLNSKGIAVRSGQHCAKILNDFLGTVATVRASVYFYTSKEDIDELVNVLKSGGDFLDAYFA